MSHGHSPGAIGPAAARPKIVHPEATELSRFVSATMAHEGSRRSLIGGYGRELAAWVEDGMSDDTAALFLAVAVENAELRAQLAEAQDLLVETAVDAGELHGRMEELQGELVEARAERDAWRAEAEPGRRAG